MKRSLDLSPLKKSLSQSLKQYALHTKEVSSGFKTLFHKFPAWTWLRVRLFLLYSLPISLVALIVTLIAIVLSSKSGGDIMGIITFVLEHKVITAIFLLCMLLLLLIGIHLFFWANILLAKGVENILSRSSSGVLFRLLLKRSHHLSVIKWSAFLLAIVLCYVVLATISLSMLSLGNAYNGQISVLDIFTYSASLIVVGGVWYAFARWILSYTPRTTLVMYLGYIVLFFLSLVGSLQGKIFLIATLGFVVLFLQIFLTYIWTIFVTGEKIVHGKEISIKELHESQKLSKGKKLSIFLTILPFWIIIILLSNTAGFISQNLIHRHSYQTLERELHTLNQFNQGAQTGSEKQLLISDHDLLATYLPKEAFSSGESTDSTPSMDPRIQSIFDAYTPSQTQVHTGLYNDLSPVLKHEDIGALTAKTAFEKFPLFYYAATFGSTILSWILFSGLLTALLSISYGIWIKK